MIKIYSTLLLSLLFAFTVKAETNTYRLTDFFAGESIIRLEGKADSIDFAIPLASITDVNNAVLTLDVISSKALIEKRSQLVVRFNNATIGQIRFDPDRPSLISEVPIPAKLWRDGFNTLTFSVSQHYANQCVDGSAPELWSEVNMYNSTLQISSSNNVDTFTFDKLNGFFNPGIGGLRDVSLITATGVEDNITERTLSLVGQALALRNQYQPLKLRHETFDEGYVLPELETANSEWRWTEENIKRYERSAWYRQHGSQNNSLYSNQKNRLSDSLPENRTQQFHVIVGTATSLSPVLSDTTVTSIKGPYLKTEVTPSFSIGNRVIIPSAFRLIVSGNTAEDVHKAAQTLSVMDDEINVTSQITVLSQSGMEAIRLQKQLIAAPDTTYTFQDLGISAARFRDEGDFSKRASFLLPADFYVPENASVGLMLNFGYGAGNGPGSIMNVKVNDELVHGLALDNPNGQVFKNYKLSVPARYLKGGANNIDFDVTLRAPLAGVPCDEVAGSHLIFQLEHSSAIDLPDAGHVAVQPSLALFGETAYPLARFESAPASSIIIPSSDFMDSALTLSAKLAQVANAPLLNMSINNMSFKSQASETMPSDAISGSAIILGTPDSLSQVQQSEFTTAIEATKRWSYQLQNNLHNRVRNLTQDQSFKAMKVEGNTIQESDLGPQAILTAHANPDSNDTLFIVAAQTSDLLNDRVNDLVSLSMWGQLAGDFFAWSDSRSPSLVMQVNETYEIGESNDAWLQLRLWLSNNPWYWLIGFVVLVFSISLLFYLLLKRRNKKVQDSW
jgi:hypothetical protein